jgi:DNA-binding MarR family transcriptional regulator
MAGFLLARAGGRAIRDLNRALEPYGLRARHYTVLAAAAQGGLSQRDLGTMLGVDPSVVVALVDDLETAGLARREVRPGDRRTRLIVTTTAGADLLAQARALAGQADRELLAPLTTAEQATLISLLRRIT